MAASYLDIIIKSYKGAAKGLWNTIQHPWDENHFNLFYFLILVSLVVWALEVLMPWRKKQDKIRRGFWLDTFYMFFNFFLFRVIIFAALVKVIYVTFLLLLIPMGYEKGDYLIDLTQLNWGVKLVIYFFLADIVQWGVHVMLHRIPFLWKFHKVHHSIKEMGFAGHLRYHFVEVFAYQPAKYVVLALLFGFDLKQAFIVHNLTVLIGHLNHANVGWDYGPLKYFFNNPKMHIWHHAKKLPESHPHGMNFGISLSLWDYIFRTNYIPSDGRDIELGFPNDENYPEDFIGQMVEPFKREK